MLSEQNKTQYRESGLDNRMQRTINTSALRGDLREQEPMSRHTSWKTGGVADYFYSPADIDDLSVFISEVPMEIPIVWVGLGSNLLVRDGGISGVVISVVGVLDNLEFINGNEISIGAGVSCVKAARFAAKEGYSGIEFLAGIPGSVGGALAMNAGAYGGEIWRNIKQVETINRKGVRKIFSKADFEIDYRSVSLPKDEWFTACDIELKLSEKTAVTRNIKKMLSERAEAQPLGKLSCGSVFRNPPEDHAARLIESCGLKGRYVGDACVSEKHANFIINMGAATSSDIEQLIELIRTTVYEKHAVKLIPEVRVIGEARGAQ
ncbi:MAG: UDP-N-acetylenolpyruvoylglucosamine reductase [marine bacterium B5-7]|nr:MAG: UDP-N-acetylenolpyruvoylglucosamine reductase [marine bacterium B5-7]